MGRDQDDVLFAPFSTVQKKLLAIQHVQSANVSAISPEATCTAEEQISELLRARHKLAPNQENDFSVRNMTDVAEAADEPTVSLRYFSRALPASRCSSAESGS